MPHNYSDQPYSPNSKSERQLRYNAMTSLTVRGWDETHMTAASADYLLRNRNLAAYAPQSGNLASFAKRKTDLKPVDVNDDEYTSHTTSYISATTFCDTPGSLIGIPSTSPRNQFTASPHSNIRPFFFPLRHRISKQAFRGALARRSRQDAATWPADGYVITRARAAIDARTRVMAILRPIGGRIENVYGDGGIVCDHEMDDARVVGGDDFVVRSWRCGLLVLGIVFLGAFRWLFVWFGFRFGAGV